MLDSGIIFNSAMPGFAMPAQWLSDPIDAWTLGDSRVTYQIYWEDVQATFFLATANEVALMTVVPPALPAFMDITAWYRAIDPAWVDPVLLDARQGHLVAMMNIPGRYVQIGFTNGAWGITAAPPVLRITQVASKRHYKYL